MTPESKTAYSTLDHLCLFSKVQGQNRHCPDLLFTAIHCAVSWLTDFRFCNLFNSLIRGSNNPNPEGVRYVVKEEVCASFCEAHVIFESVIEEIVLKQRRKAFERPIVFFPYARATPVQLFCLSLPISPKWTDFIQ